MQKASTMGHQIQQEYEMILLRLILEIIEVLNLFDALCHKMQMMYISKYSELGRFPEKGDPCLILPLSTCNS